MVYGRILYNNIKEYTPKWFPTIPYSQTVKPVFGRKPQVVSNLNAKSSVKAFWRLIDAVVMKNSWVYQVFVFGIAFTMYHALLIPGLALYRANNANRTYETAMIKERAHKKALREKEEAEQ